jgi:citrate synthase
VLVIRGHNAKDLAETQPFEAVWHLLFEGRLPASPAELRRYAQRISDAGQLTRQEHVAVRQCASGDPLAAIRTAVSAVAAIRGLQPWLYRDVATVRQEALTLAASLPTIILDVHAVLTHQSPPQSVAGATYVGNYLAGITRYTETPEQEEALNRYFTLAVDHGMNASTFVARAVTSTGADLGAVVTAALGALSGPLHGGAPSGVLEMLDEIGEPDRAYDWLVERVRSGKRIMGFGHRVYRTEDPRSASLKQLALRHGDERAELALAVETAAERVLAELKPGRELHPNVELWAAVIFEQCDIPESLFTATFCCSRVVGWMAHALEQMADNRIMRPTSRYVGPALAPKPVTSKAAR